MLDRKLKAIIIASVAIACGLCLYHFNGDSVSPADRQVVLVVTDSMDGNVTEYDIDSFPANTLVMVKHLSPYERQFLRVGDVVSYNDNGTLVHHRVVQVNEGSVYVHGDNNHSTEIVQLDDINGKVIGVSPAMGQALALVSGNFIAFLAVMFVIAAAIAVYGVYRSDPKEAVE
jgi:hypothetical protein